MTLLGRAKLDSDGPIAGANYRKLLLEDKGRASELTMINALAEQVQIAAFPYRPSQAYC
jgi:hypothetical protein